MKISHHGSKYNTNSRLLKLIDTNLYVISTNGENEVHPNKRTLARIIKNKPNCKILFNYPELKDKIFKTEDYRFTDFSVEDTLNYTEFHNGK